MSRLSDPGKGANQPIGSKSAEGRMNGRRTLRGADGARWLLELFLAADLDRSGELDRPELTAVLQQLDLGLKPDELDNLMDECDKDDDGLYTYKVWADNTAKRAAQTPACCGLTLLLQAA